MTSEAHTDASDAGRTVPEATAGGISMRELAPVLNKIRPFTMVSRASLVDLARQVHAALACGIPGDFVECGVWRGGASFFMAELLRRAGVADRRVWMFDSFQQLPAPEEIDGRAAATAFAREGARSPSGAGRWASLEEVQRSARELGVDSHVVLVKGWFEDTLAANRDRIGQIAILRIDCDWYAGVRCCLENLYDHVAEGGFVVLDDYYAFDGCAIAVHEFLAEWRLSHRLEGVIDDRMPAVFRKGSTTWFEAKRWMEHIREVDLATREIASVVPRGQAFVLVDQETLGYGVDVAGRRRLPFLERDGRYWGLPPDANTAIKELERLRHSDARFLVFAWPAFWWLRHYAAFRKYVDEHFPCVLRSKRVRVFDIRAVGRPRALGGARAGRRVQRR